MHEPASRETRHRTDYSMVRWAIALVIALAGLLPASAPLPSAAQETRFDFDATVPADELVLVAEGIRLAEDFFTQELGYTAIRPVLVSVDNESHDTSSVIASAMGPSIFVYAGSLGWRASNPTEQLRSVLHEFTHVYQYMSTGSVYSTSAAWFEEGLAEYLSLEILARLGIVHRGDVMDYWYGAAQFMGAQLDLADISMLEDFQAAGGAVYPLAAVGVASLLADRPIETINTYYGSISSNESFASAFETAFGIPPETFYRQFERDLARLTGSIGLPDDFEGWSGDRQNNVVKLIRAPEILEPGQQLIILGKTDGGDTCTLTLSEPGQNFEKIERHSEADRSGELFWLISIPESWPTGKAAIVVEC